MEAQGVANLGTVTHSRDGTSRSSSLMRRKMQLACLALTTQIVQSVRSFSHQSASLHTTLL